MTREEITAVLKSALSDVDGIKRSADQIAGDEEIIAGLGLDSLDYAMVLVECERALDVSVLEDDIDWRTVRTVDDLAGVLVAARKRD